MKKGIIGILIGIGLVLSPTSYAKADTQLEVQYKDAYDSTMNIVNVAEKYGVRSFGKYGQCHAEDLLKAIEEEKLDTEILKARDKVNSLPPSIQIHKNTLSSILDNYQHQLYYQVTESLNLLGGWICNGDKEDDLVEKYYRLTRVQEIIMQDRVFIKNMQDEYKYSYSTAIDEKQQKLLNSLVNFVNTSETKNDPCFKYCSIKTIEDSKNYIKDDQVLQDFFNCLLKKANALKVGHVVSDDEILNFVTKNGFEDVTVNESAIFKGEKAYKLLVNKQGDAIEFYKSSKTVIYKCKRLNTASRDTILGFMTPKKKDSLNNKASLGIDGYYVAEKGFLATVTTSRDSNVFVFYRCYYNE